MPKYLITWETDVRQLPNDEKEQWNLYIRMLEETKRALEEDPSSDWGQFEGCNKGYAVCEKKYSELMQTLRQFAPYLSFDVQEVLSVDQCTDAIRRLINQRQDETDD